jgi:hypothetical protein
MMAKHIAHVAAFTAVGGSVLVAIGLLAPARIVAQGTEQATESLQGRAAFTDWSADRRGLRRLIRPADLPAADLGASFSSGLRIEYRSASEKPVVPPGFEVDLFAEGLDEPRLIRAAPNGDIFVAESSSDRNSRAAALERWQCAARCLPRILQHLSASRSILLAQIPNGSMSPIPVRSCALHITTATSPHAASLKQWCHSTDRRPLYTQHCVLARWIEDVRVGRLGIQCR